MHKILTGPLQVENLRVKIADLPSRLEGTKLVQLSDFHYDGRGLSEELLEEAIATTNAAKPDLILLTGDYVTDDPSPIGELALRLKGLESRAGIFAILGNHDNYLPGAKEKVINALEAIGIRVLYNEAVYPLGSDLALVGLADFWSGDFQPEPVMKAIAPDVPRIVLSHNPDTAEVLQRWRVDLQLSGHTHGGQVDLPRIGPLPQYIKPIRSKVPSFLRPIIPYMADCYKVVRHWEWARGIHQVGDNYLYVNRGLGTYFPGRLFCPPEVTLIELTTNN
ncbi:MAG: metallophosphoesterase [Cyanobacteriota bacterium]|nr:metallophosphoesterase [Cyanobacteriota bacterium]